MVRGRRTRQCTRQERFVCLQEKCNSPAVQMFISWLLQETGGSAQDHASDADSLGDLPTSLSL
ncbi:hypothetical protein CF70_031390 [Cupriavidus sp. SK-3]|nr:hypothetical protein CF70_031390 [Cupriavidus sp. SK-3]